MRNFRLGEKMLKIIKKSNIPLKPNGNPNIWINVYILHTAFSKNRFFGNLNFLLEIYKSCEIFNIFDPKSPAGTTGTTGTTFKCHRQRKKNIELLGFFWGVDTGTTGTTIFLCIYKNKKKIKINFFISLYSMFSVSPVVPVVPAHLMRVSRRNFKNQKCHRVVPVSPAQPMRVSRPFKKRVCCSVFNNCIFGA